MTEKLFKINFWDTYTYGTKLCIYFNFRNSAHLFLLNLFLVKMNLKSIGQFLWTVLLTILYNHAHYNVKIKKGSEINFIYLMTASLLRSRVDIDLASSYS